MIYLILMFGLLFSVFFHNLLENLHVCSQKSHDPKMGHGHHKSHESSHRLLWPPSVTRLFPLREKGMRLGLTHQTCFSTVDQGFSQSYPHALWQKGIMASSMSAELVLQVFLLRRDRGREEWRKGGGRLIEEMKRRKGKWEIITNNHFRGKLNYWQCSCHYISYINTCTCTLALTCTRTHAHTRTYTHTHTHTRTHTHIHTTHTHTHTLAVIGYVVVHYSGRIPHMYLPPHQRGSSGEERKRNRDS